MQIGLVLLIALSAKNAILIVEVARELRREGKAIVESAIGAARARFRPIVMTSFAFILGMLPLVLATGAGASAGVDRHHGVPRHASRRPASRYCSCRRSSWWCSASRNGARRGRRRRRPAPRRRPIASLRAGGGYRNLSCS